MRVRRLAQPNVRPGQEAGHPHRLAKWGAMIRAGLAIGAKRPAAGGGSDKVRVSAVGQLRHRRLPAEKLRDADDRVGIDRKSTRLNSSHSQISYAVFCLKKKQANDCGCFDWLAHEEHYHCSPGTYAA